MLNLKDSINVRTTPEQLFKWLEEMPKEYCSWHPDHVSCRVLKGSMLQVGSEIKCVEKLHGKLHSMRFRLTKVDPGKRIEYQIVGLGRGAFEVIQKGEEVEFIAELNIGTGIPVLGWMLDGILLALFQRRIESMKQHMLEEGQNLKKIIESGWIPRVKKNFS